MRLALTDLFKARWTDRIHDEWINALMREQRHSRETLEGVRDLMDRHVRDAKVHGYEKLIDSLQLPDPNDQHVLAAAIRSGASAIVTFNLKDFPAASLEPFAIDVIHPDDFILYQIDMAPTVCCRAIREQRLSLRNPEMDVDALLKSLQKQQLPQTVSRLRQYFEFL